MTATATQLAELFAFLNEGEALYQEAQVQRPVTKPSPQIPHSFGSNQPTQIKERFRDTQPSQTVSGHPSAHIPYSGTQPSQTVSGHPSAHIPYSGTQPSQTVSGHPSAHIPYSGTQPSQTVSGHPSTRSLLGSTVGCSTAPSPQSTTAMMLSSTSNSTRLLMSNSGVNLRPIVPKKSGSSNSNLIRDARQLLLQFRNRSLMPPSCFPVVVMRRGSRDDEIEEDMDPRMRCPPSPVSIAGMSDISVN